MGKISKVSTVGMSRAEWLAERRKGIGGSDMGAILGLNPYASPYSVWLDKTGRAEEREDGEAMRQGRDLEQYVVSRFEEVSGKKARRINAIISNSDFPHIQANIDRDIVGEDSGLECKTASALNERCFGAGTFPESYYAQCVTYMSVLEYSRYYLAVVVLGRAFKVYQLTRIADDTCPEWCESSVYVEQGEIDTLKQVAIDFWKYVEKDKQPPVDGSEPTSDALAARYSTSNGRRIDLFGFERIFTEYRAACANVARAEDQKRLYEQTIKAALGENEVGCCGEIVATWKPQSRSTFDADAFAKDHADIDLSPYYKPSTFRRFTVKEPKE